MAMQGKELDHQYAPMFILTVLVFLAMLYWNCWGFLNDMGWTWVGIDNVLMKLYDSGMLVEWKVKTFIFIMTFLSGIIKSGKSIKTPWLTIIIMNVVSLAIFYIPWFSDLQFLCTGTVGFLLMIYWIPMIGRKMKGAKNPGNDPLETFDQETKKIETKYSVNLPMRFKYKGKVRRGWVNFVNPMRACALFGVPGSGKSYTVYYQFIDQMIRKGFTMFVYDFKFPDLTEIVYNKWLQYYPPEVKRIRVTDPSTGEETFREESVPKKGSPQFCMINFDDPRKSHRCNPLDSRYLTDMSDAHEVASLIMKNINPKSAEKEDFFSMSAKVYVAALIWFLKTYQDGVYCSFPHLIELMGKDYKKVFLILEQDKKLSIMIRPFADALKDKAQEQLQGQIASARIPLLKFPSASLYWALTGNDFSLDLNNPDEPKILCIGNNPDRQDIYGTALALYTSRIFRVINHKRNKRGKRNLPCGVMLDELPTMFIKGIATLIATARSNLVCILIGCQDKSQLVNDYGREEATVVINTVGSIISGQVNGETAKDMSATFGREFRLQESETTGGTSDTVSRSYQQQEILPQSRIETLTQGYFFGKVADDQSAPLKKKLFCGEMIVDVKARTAEEKAFKKIPKCGAQYFKDDIIEKYVRENAKKEMKQYINDSIMAEHSRRRRYDEFYNIPVPDAIWSETETRYAALEKDKKEYENVLREVITKLQDEYMQRRLEENYEKVQMDIDEIMENFGLGDNSDNENGPDGSSGGTPTEEKGGSAPADTNPASEDDAAKKEGASSHTTKPASEDDATKKDGTSAHGTKHTDTEHETSKNNDKTGKDDFGEDLEDLMNGCA